MNIMRNGKKFNVVENCNTVNEKILLNSVDIETARLFIANNSNDEIFTRDYKNNYFDSGKYDLWGGEAKANSNEFVECEEIENFYF